MRALLSLVRKIPQQSASNSFLYNAMIHPMVRFTIKGAIWYQGQHWINLNINLALNCELFLCHDNLFLRKWEFYYFHYLQAQGAL
jgi:hypothetical protein